MREKKIRGIKRKTKNMVNRIEENTMTFPTEFYNGNWHMHLPVGQDFISSDKTPQKVKRSCIQALVDRAEYLKGLQPHGDEKYRVAVLITLPSLWNSQIIIFKGEDDFKDFFNRDSDYYKWIPLSDDRNIQTDWKLAIPDDFAITGFKEVIDDEDGYYESEIWFIGDIK